MEREIGMKMTFKFDSLSRANFIYFFEENKTNGNLNKWTLGKKKIFLHQKNDDAYQCAPK